MPSTGPAIPAYYQNVFPPSEFRERRERLMEQIGGGVALLQGAPASGAMEPFRQYNDFFYFCGVEVPHAYLLIDGRSRRTTLFLAPCDQHLREAEGPELNADDAEVAQGLTGVEEVKPLALLGSDLAAAPLIYLSRAAPEGRQMCQDSVAEARRLADADPWRWPKHEEIAIAERLQSRLGPVELRDLAPLIAGMRRRKSGAEIALLRRAGEITARAICEAMRCTRPGLVEDQLAAVADFVFRVNGARGAGYRPIVASGDNAWNIHYFRNNARLQEGDLVLMDYAPDICNYTMDIGRMWPVGGKYSKPQRELYGFVVDYHRVLIDLIKPGKTPRQVREEAAAELAPAASRASWSSPWFAGAVETLLKTSRAMTHGVGMSVHEEGGYQDDDTELEPGVVFALDPQLWVNEEHRYIRVEDTVLITETGVEVFTPQAPLELDEVEALMAEPGLIQSRGELLVPASNGRV